LGPTQPSIQREPGVIPLGVKRPGREAGHLPPSTAEFKKGGAIPPLPHMSLWDSASLIYHREKFTLPYVISFGGLF
jgi:hypothetical protein